MLFTYGDPMQIYNTKNENGFFGFTHKSWMTNSSQEIINSFPQDSSLSCKLFKTERDAFFHAQYSHPNPEQISYKTKRCALFDAEYDEAAEGNWQTQDIKVRVMEYPFPPIGNKDNNGVQLEKEISVEYLEVPRNKIKLIYGALKIPSGSYENPELTRTLLEYHYVGWQPNCVII